MAQEMVSQPTPREPTLIDYARYHGIAYDHRLATPPLDNLPPLLPPPSDEEDEPNSRTSYSSEEKLEVPRQAVRWFGRICHQLSAQPDEEWDHESLEYRRWITRTKLEPPALESDHQWDVVEFRQKHDISLDMLEGAEPDEDALGYTEAERERSEQLADDVENEKLQIPRAAFGWLQSLVKDFRLDYRLEVEGFHKAYAKKKAALQPLSLPDLPFQICARLHIPSSSMGEFQILSDPVDPSIAARLELEAKIMADEQIFMPPLSGSLAGWEETASVTDDRTADAVAIADDDLAALDGIDPAILEAKTIPSSPPRRFRPAAEAKLELPLLDSLTAAPCPALRKVTFEEVASEGLLAAVDAAQIPPEEPESDLQQALGDAAQRFLEGVEHERLVPGETSMRILAPALSFEKKTLPWKEKIVLDRARLQASFFNEADLPDAQPIEQATSGALRWNPFPSVSRDGLLKETIDSTDSIDRLLAVTGFNEPMNSDDFFWKPEGLRIFDNSHDSDQPELLPAIFPRPKDIQGLVRKRKHDADRETGGGIGEKSTSNPATKVMKQLSNDSASTGMTSLLQEALLRRRQKAQPQRPMNMGEPAVVLDDGLIGFLRSRHQTVLATPGLQQLAMAPNLMDAAQGGISPQREVSAAQKPRSKTVSSISGVQVSRTFVISSRFLRENLSLLRQIELLYPNASLLERSSMLGFDEARKPHDRRPSLLPSSPPLTDLAHQSEPNSGDHSVDLQLDPTTGFVFTSVGFIKQRPLPGQKSITGGIRERVMSAVRLAESSSGIDRLGSTRSRTNSDKQVADWKLYVIVILPPSDSWETADSSRTADRQALGEFEGWILRLAEWSGIDVRMKAWQDDGVKDGERPEPLRGLALELVKAMVCHDGFASEL